MGGQLIIGHPGLDMVVLGRDLGVHDAQGLLTFGAALWELVRPAVVAEDPMFRVDEAGFCEAYGSNSHAPNMK